PAPSSGADPGLVQGLSRPGAGRDEAQSPRSARPGAADDERFRSPCLAEAAMNTTRSVEFDDIQGLVRFGYKHHTEAAFLLLRVKDREAARRWLANVPVSSAATTEPLPEIALQIALSAQGMRALGVDGAIVDSFAAEFVSGMADDA